MTSAFITSQSTHQQTINSTYWKQTYQSRGIACQHLPLAFFGHKLVLSQGAEAQLHLALGRHLSGVTWHMAPRRNIHSVPYDGLHDINGFCTIAWLFSKLTAQEFRFYECSQILPTKIFSNLFAATEMSLLLWSQNAWQSFGTLRKWARSIIGIGDQIPLQRMCLKQTPASLGLSSYGEESKACFHEYSIFCPVSISSSLHTHMTSPPRYP